MELIERLFPRYDERGKELIHNAYEIASEALAEQKRIVAKLEEILPLCERLK